MIHYIHFFLPVWVALLFSCINFFKKLDRTQQGFLVDRFKIFSQRLATSLSAHISLKFTMFSSFKAKIDRFESSLLAIDWFGGTP